MTALKKGVLYAYKPVFVLTTGISIPRKIPKRPWIKRNELLFVKEKREHFAEVSFSLCKGRDRLCAL